MKVRDLFVNVPLLRLLVQRELPAPLSYRIGTRVRQFSGEWDEIEKQRRSLLEQFAEKGEDGEIRTEGEEQKIIWADREGFDKAWEELLETEVDVEVKPFSVELFDKYESAVILPAEIMALEVLGCLE